MEIFIILVLVLLLLLLLEAAFALLDEAVFALLTVFALLDEAFDDRFPARVSIISIDNMFINDIMLE